jgi:DNA-binding MarR family transcriptional regulator
VPRKTLDHVRALQAESLGYLLVRAGQLWSERVLSIVHAEAGAPVVREAHTRLFPHLLAEHGIRITDLARALGVTKQAVQPLVAELAALHVVRVAPDPDDARARRVHLTEHGIAAMVHGTGVLLRVEAELAPRLGARDTAQLKRLLGKLLPLLERAQEPPSAARGPATGGTPRRRR